MKTKTILIAVVALIAVIIVASGIYVLTLPPPLKELVIGIKRDIGSGLDPALHMGADDNTYNMLMYENLVGQKVEMTGEVSLFPELATSWEVYNETAYKFHLREGVKFHCGQIMTAEDVKYSFDRLWTWEKSLPKHFFGALNYVEIVDNYTVIIGSDTPFGPILSYLANDAYHVICSKDAEENGWDNVVLNPCGTGRYKFVSYEKGEKMVFERFAEYWGNPGYFDRVVLKIIGEDATRIIALETGGVDVIDQVPPEQVEELKAKGLHVEISAGNRVVGLLFNVKKPPLDDVRVRQALSWAVNTTAICNEIFQGMTEPSKSVFGHGTFGRTETEVYGYDPEKARQLLAEAGYPDGLPEPLKVWVFYGTYVKDREVYTAVFEYFEAVGVTVDLEISDWPSTSSAINANMKKVYDGDISAADVPYHMMENSYGDPMLDADYPLTAFNWAEKPAALASKSRGYYSNPILTDLIAAAAAELQMDKRLEYYSEIQDILLEDAPYIWFYCQPVITAWRSDLQGVEVNPTGYTVYRGAYLG